MAGTLPTTEPADQPRPEQRFVSATMLQHHNDLLIQLMARHRQYTKYSQEDEYGPAA